MHLSPARTSLSVTTSTPKLTLAPVASGIPTDSVPQARLRAEVLELSKRLAEVECRARNGGLDADGFAAGVAAFLSKLRMRAT